MVVECSGFQTLQCPKFRRLLENHLLDVRSNPVVSAQNLGSGGNAYVGCECNFLEPYFVPFAGSILRII